MNLCDYQSGKFVQQFEYLSFSPAKINHCWDISDPKILQLLSEADRSLGELNAYSKLVPQVDFFIRMHIAKEATQSSRIEGTRTNIEEAMLAIKDIASERRDDWQEVQNYIHATHYAINQLDQLPLSSRLLKNTHKILLQGVRGQSKHPGEFRKSQNWIGINLKNAVFIPPHQDELQDLMSDLESFIQNESLNLPHLIKIAIAHYQFETIHPFLDGNGRLGRLLISIYLANFQLMYKPALYLSDYFERYKTSYVDHMMAVRQANKMSQWIEFFLIGVAETANNSIAVFKNILTLKSNLEAEFIPTLSRSRQIKARKLLDFLYQSPTISIAQVAELLDIKPNTASLLVEYFVKHGVLEELTNKKRNRIFSFHKYIDIFKQG